MKVCIEVCYVKKSLLESTDNITNVIYLPPYYMTSEITEEVKKHINLLIGENNVISYSWRVTEG